MEKKFISHHAAKKYAKQLPFGKAYVKGNKVITTDCGGQTSVPSGCGYGYKDSVTRVQHFKKQG